MGTPDFSVPVLEALIENNHEVVCVVTQNDKEKGRGKSIQFPPVKDCAIKHNIPVYQPGKIKTPEAIEVLKAYNADLFVVIAFGQILSQEILDIPKYGCVNIHASLLPRYRGAAPIQWAVIDGEKYSGVTIMRMDAGLDTGDMMLKEAIELSEDETGESLHDKLSVLGAKLIVEAIEKIEDNTITYEKQDGSKMTYAKMLTKSLGHIDFTKPAVEIERLIRGLNSWPSAYTFINGKMLKIWKAEVIEDANSADIGKIVEVNYDGIVVQTGVGKLRLLEVQLEGKKRMRVSDFIRGYNVMVGSNLGES